MIRYLETFYRHRILLLAPIVLAVAASLGLTLMQPRLYEASAKVWVDTWASPLGDTNSNGYAPPADSQAADLKEVLQTRSFGERVGRRADLAVYLAAYPNAYTGPLSSIVGWMGSVGSTASAGSNADALDNVLFDVVSHRTTVFPVGPHILSVSFDAPNAAVAASTTQAIVDEFIDQTRGDRQYLAQNAVSFYKQQLASTPKPAVTDELARQRYASLQDKLDQAQLELAALTQPGAGGLRLVDAPLVPDRAKGMRTALLLAGVAGSVIGVSLSLLLLMFLTWSDTSIRVPEEAETLLGRRIVSVVPRAR